MRSNAELMAEARYIARLTCQQVELVLAEVKALDRMGLRMRLIGWCTGELIPLGHSDLHV